MKQQNNLTRRRTNKLRNEIVELLMFVIIITIVRGYG